MSYDFTEPCTRYPDSDRGRYRGLFNQANQMPHYPAARNAGIGPVPGIQQDKDMAAFWANATRRSAIYRIRAQPFF